MTAHRIGWRDPILWLMIAPPLAAVIAGIVILLIALSTDDGLVVDDYYRQGKEINRVLARDQAATARAVAAEVNLDHARRRLTLTLEAVAPPRLHVTLWHATRAGLDRRFDLERGNDDTYRGALPPLVPGRWHVQLEADDWRLIGALRVPEETRLRLDAGAP